MSPLATVFVMQSQTQRRFNDATSAEKAAKCRWFTFGPRHSGKPTNDTPGKGLAGRISKAWPLTFPAVFFLSRPISHGTFPPSNLPPERALLAAFSRYWGLRGAKRIHPDIPMMVLR